MIHHPGEISLSSRELEKRQLEEFRKEILKQLIAGDGGTLESLAELGRKAGDSPSPEDNPLYSLIETLSKESKITGEQYNLLLSTLTESSQSRAENQLDLRLAVISLIIENTGTAEWYFYVYNTGAGMVPGSALPDMEALLLSDWERANYELIKARAELELAALNFLEGKDAGEEAIILASQYSGDAVKRSQDRQILEQILELLHSYRATPYSPGDFHQFLSEIATQNDRRQSLRPRQ